MLHHLIFIVVAVLNEFYDYLADRMWPGMFLLMAALLLIPIRSGKWIQPASDIPLLDEASDETEALVRPDEFTISLGQLSLWDSMRTVDFVLFFIVVLCASSTGDTSIRDIRDLIYSRENNITINTHHNYTKSELAHSSEADSLIALFSAFNAIGRLSMGLLSDILHQRMYSRAWILVISLVLMFGGQFGLVRAQVDMFYIFIIVVALCYGAVLSVVPAMCLELFGIANFAVNWSVLSLGCAIGSELIASMLAAYLKCVQMQK